MNNLNLYATVISFRPHRGNKRLNKAGPAGRAVKFCIIAVAFKQRIGLADK